MDSEQADKVATFSAMTGTNPSTAQATLESTNWNLEEAANLFFAAADTEPGHDADEPFGAEEPAANQTTPSTSQPPAQPSQSSSRGSSQRRPPGQAPRAMTLRDLQRGSEDSGDDDEHKKQDMFAGGEKSGLAVQNPDKAGGPIDHFKNIMDQARQNRDRPPAAGEEEQQQPQRSSNFSGRAQTLGGDDAPSQVIEDPMANARRPHALPRVTRTLHLWADGISIDDGPLFRFDDPANQQIMAQVNQGRAPLSLLNVQPDQEVDLNLDPHKDENYVQPKPKYKPFSGQGQRLGSPTPGASTSSATSASTSQAPSAPAAATGPPSATVAVDENAPTVRLQIRLGDGTRLQSRFNITHTVNDVYDFVYRSSPASTTRNYVLMTTFPNKEYTDKSAVLGELEEFKRGGVLVQKWA